MPLNPPPKVTEAATSLGVAAGFRPLVEWLDIQSVVADTLALYATEHSDLARGRAQMLRELLTVLKSKR